MEQKQVLIVDDHAVMRVGLRELLNDFYPGVRTEEAQDGDSMLEKLKTRQFNLIILDIQMSNTDTVRMVELVSIKYPDVDVLIFSMLPEKIYGRRLIQAGAKGFLPKSAPIDEIRKAFDLVLQSRRYVSTAMAGLLSEEMLEERALNPFSLLSDREFDIAHDLLTGNSINAIAQRLNLKPSTVGTYKARIFEKLRVNNIFELKDLATLYHFIS